ncbi:2-hydroxychromene-2-carboxylate isomerase [Labilithrix luteola]|uniref:2-hydroxychromene-2-carboxylate isomerase n=1 Tax=Labilithrix luteola TaxID=1391654 RepID=A0A0K1Q0Q8_9BACT|nr:2-hydroxychromene-2-carboxylate isomerase [Labilithrix luteola]AKU98999.1 2-hydroxychromene-2-carboxylate isomerase [Labilithrix luteola]
MEPIEPSRRLPARSLDFWFDYTCPFAYLASTRVRELGAEMGVTPSYRPMLLGGVFRASGTPQNLAGTLSPSKASHNFADMKRWAARFGVPLTMPQAHPMRSVEALRATLATGVDPAVVDGFYEAYWVHNRDIANAEVIGEVVERAGHDRVAVLAKMASTEIKDDLRRRTEEAVSLGIFGAPTFIVDGEHLYWGQDRMTFVRGARPEHETEGVPTPRVAPEPVHERIIEVYWDFSSPFAYLGQSQIERLAAQASARVVWRPVLLGGLFRAVGSPTVPIATFSESKRRHVMLDLGRWAAYWGVPFRFPAKFPIRSVRALRVWLALPEEHRDAFRTAVFRSYWEEGRDIEVDAVLAECIGDESVAKAAFAAADSDAVKEGLRAETEAAAARGVFGVPTFVVGDELYWGQDRLELALEALTGA